ncbi:MAG: T9SS type A sorting domain-containing protein [Ignavibacteria bacterium]
MKKIIGGLCAILLTLCFCLSSAYSQTNNVIDSFGDHKLPGWYWGGNLTMKYSHENDNLENGYAEILATDAVTGANSFVGLIRKEQKIQVTEDNILTLMLQGVSLDMNATVQILFDRNNDGRYDENFDTRLESKPISLNFSGWKEIHININENEFKVISKLAGEDFSILENEAMGIQISYQTGKDFKTAKIETGIALISERPNKEVKQETANSQDNSTESYFNLKNYPNPFNPETNISYVLKNSTYVKITIYDRLGREVSVLVDGQQNEGEHSIKFNASNLPSGIYFYRLKTTEKTEVKKMVLAK